MQFVYKAYIICELFEAYSKEKHQILLLFESDMNMFAIFILFWKQTYLWKEENTSSMILRLFLRTTKRSKRNNRRKNQKKCSAYEIVGNYDHYCYDRRPLSLWPLFVIDIPPLAVVSITFPLLRNLSWLCPHFTRR